MCGIFGVWATKGQTVDVQALHRGTTAIRHRGPDDEGYLLANLQNSQVTTCGGADTMAGVDLPDIRRFDAWSAQLAFGFRRLAILDLSPSGHQPMSYGNGRYWIIFNGEIYNYLELRQELQMMGYAFSSQADTEVLLAGFSAWGVDMLPRLIGMFAFAILDMEARRLVLARDFFGIKPLYYSLDAGFLTFSSEIKALLAYGLVNRKVNPNALYAYLRHGVTDDGADTMFDGVFHLPAAHYLDISLDDQQIPAPKRYWQISSGVNDKISFKDAAEHLRNLFLHNVQLHLRSDVPVGTALSGGIDSTSIIMAIRQLQGKSSQIHAFSYVVDDPGVGEENWVDLACQSSGATSHKTRPSPEELQNELEDLIYYQDEPFGGTSIYAQHRVFRLVQENGIKVMLDGQGADEILAGYHPYFAARLGSYLRQGDFKTATEFARNVMNIPRLDKKKFLFRGGAWVLPHILQSVARDFVGESLQPGWLRSDWFTHLGVKPKPLAEAIDSPDILRQLLLQATCGFSLPLLLRYEDRNSMAHSVESRVPFLTPDLVNFVFSLPEEYLINRDALTKSVFRRAMHDITPVEILNRREKIGFATPETQWLFTLRPWIEEVLHSETAKRIPAINLSRLEEDWRGFLSGDYHANARVWGWINLIRWADRFMVDFDV